LKASADNLGGKETFAALQREIVDAAKADLSHRESWLALFRGMFLGNRTFVAVCTKGPLEDEMELANGLTQPE
jgi:hypothetical protein